MIPFNKIFLTGNEQKYINEALISGKISGNGSFTKKCQNFFEKKYSFKKTLLTTSCTDALEMCAMLANLKEGDEVIIPSFTFVSTALAFLRTGAKVVFADSYADNPNIDPKGIERLINKKTKAIIVVHYAGIACDMDAIMSIANKNNLIVIEDAAHAIDSYYTDRKGVKKPLGSIGHLAAFSFHETKNIVSGEGGLLVINDDRFIERAEIIWENGTNRSKFFRGEIDKYGWVDIGASFLASDILAAFLWAQLEAIDEIQAKRVALWNHYYETITNSCTTPDFEIAPIPDYASQNGHMFYLVAKNLKTRNKLLALFKNKGYHAVFHYSSLHKSSYYTNKHDSRILINSDRFSDCLIRLPLFVDLEFSTIDQMVADVLMDSYIKKVI
ncbi:dTDP-4-amino-4,6-dideoxygalactose transaminase [Algibacter sp. 2305UL17-15]|uniref:dTDP-4-amino-4,6-dideoxygalactose transaminase n=1 Tax=Algibacter sp. 2305UL17-15 TaxID=3231268 RepID=UPI003458D984